MAVIGNIRKRSGLVIVLIGVSLAAFILTDLLSSRYGLMGRQSTVVGEINGEKINYNDFENKAKIYEENYKNQLQGQEFTDEMRNMIREQVWNDYIEENVNQEQYDILGLKITGEELTWLEFKQAQPNQLIQQAFTDPNTRQVAPNYADSFGQLDLNKVKAMRQNMEEGSENEQQWINGIDAPIMKERVKTKFRFYLANSVGVNSLEVENENAMNSDVIAAKIVGKSYFSIADSLVTVTEADKKAYLNKNAKKYEQKESRSLEFVTFNLDPSAEDSIATENDILKIKSSFIKAKNDSAFMALMGEQLDTTFKSRGSLSSRFEDSIFAGEVNTVYGPYYENGTFTIVKLIAVEQDTVPFYRASHILIKPENATAEDTLKAQKEAADILAGIKGGNNFSEQAALLSKDPGSANNGGEIGWFDKDRLVKPFYNAVIKTPVGGYAIATSEFGVHIIKVTGGPSYKKVKVAQISRQIEVGSATDRELYAKAVEFTSKSMSGKDNYEKTLADMKLTNTIVKDIKPDASNVSGLNDARELVKWSFRDDAKVGDISEPFAVANKTKYVVARISAIKEKGTPKVEDIDEVLTADLVKEKKALMIKEDLENAKKDAGTDMVKIAIALKTVAYDIPNQSLNNTNLPYVGDDPIVAGYLFGMAKDKVSEPIKGKNGVYVALVTSQSKGTMQEDAKMFKQRMTLERKQSVERMISESLKKSATIVDNRYKFY